MARDEIDRAEWARIITDLMAEHTKGKKAPFARMVSVDPSTVDNWLNQAVQVSEDRVRQVARVFNLSPIDLLIRVGLYEPSQIPAATQTAAVDEEEQLILSADISDERKRHMLDRLHSRREDERQRRMADLRWMLGQDGDEDVG